MKETKQDSATENEFDMGRRVCEKVFFGEVTIGANTINDKKEQV